MATCLQKSKEAVQVSSPFHNIFPLYLLRIDRLTCKLLFKLIFFGNLVAGNITQLPDIIKASNSLIVVTDGNNNIVDDKSKVLFQTFIIIIVGLGLSGIVLAIIVTIILIYFPKLLRKVGFLSQWKKDFPNSQINENPLYQSSVKEVFNPLYKGKDLSETSNFKVATLNVPFRITKSEKEKRSAREQELGFKR